MRITVSVIFLILIFALFVCTVTAHRSRKAIGPELALLLLSLIPPVMGNLILTISGDSDVSSVGRYIYCVGMDLVMFSLLRFTFSYCKLSWPKRWVRDVVCLLLAGDAIQLLCNPLFGHAFSTGVIELDGFPYYTLIPHWGQTFHRVLDYGIFGAVLLIFLFKTVNTPRIYSERYSVIFLTMIFSGLWQTFYIFSGTPVDRSMIGFGIFGLLVFYFSLYYRPMRLLDQMLANIASEMPEALFFFDLNSKCIWANKPGIALARIQGDDFESANQRLEEMFGSFDRREENWSSRPILYTGTEKRFYVLEKRAVTDPKGRITGSFLSVRDNTEEQMLLQREKYNATHDTLTDLYVREYFYDQVRRTLLAHPERTYMVVFVDVSNFKMVNDVFGTAFGDLALRRIADWIRGVVTPDCVYGRLAGDTFGACLPAEQFAPDRLEQDLSGFIVSDGPVRHHILIHLGVYQVRDPNLDVSVMFDRAHLAISTIKEEFQIHIAYYGEEMRSQVLWNQHITLDLHQALEQRQILPYLQPLVDYTGRLVGAEVLVRWLHPKDGLLPPSRFIPVFEKNGLIAELDRFMWCCACEILADWQARGIDLFLSVNISPKDFFFMDVPAQIKEIVAAHAVPPSRLRLEITEAVMMREGERRAAILTELREAGFIVEMDDFGSGYSSLNMLKDIPVDVLKIDMMFLNASKDNVRARTILNNILTMADDLGIVSLTEGVETRSQYEMLSAMGCKLFQGYYFAKPMPLEDFEVFRSTSAEKETAEAP